MADRQPLLARGQDAPLPFEAYIEAGEKKGLLWTPLRRRVFEFFWRERKPLGAYDVTRRLLKEGKAHSNSIYRALRALEQAGLIVPVRLLKRYLIAPDPERADWSALICDGCGSASLRPLPPEADDIHTIAEAHGFSVRDLVVECAGRCARCTTGEPGQPVRQPPGPAPS